MVRPLGAPLGSLLAGMYPSSEAFGLFGSLRAYGQAHASPSWVCLLVQQANVLHRP
jgi:hypothetical protein